MYLNYYGFAETPFSLVPNPRFIFYSKTHKEAFALLLYGINNRFGFIQLTGEVGTGKTTVLRTLLSQLNEEQYRTALIFNPSLSAIDLLRAINHELGIACAADNGTELLGNLNRFLLQENAAGHKVVLIIDEAQNLAPDVLEQIRLISNLETNTTKLIQIILAGQPELGQLLDRPELRQINQRIALRYHLRPLDRDDCKAYIDHRLAMAGGRDRVFFTPAALRWLYHCSRGTPRLINILSDRALLVAYTRNRREITARTITLAFRDVMLKPALALSPALRTWGAVALLLVLLAICGYAYRPVAPTAAPAPTVPVVKKTGGQAPPPSAPATTEAQPVAPGFAQAVRNELAVRSETKNAVLAFNALAALWQAPPVRRVNERAPLAQELKQCAGKRHLEMTPFTGGMDELLRLGAPALLTLSPRDTKGTFVVALTGVRDGQLLIQPPLLGRSAFSRTEIASVWSGRAHILWRNGKGIRCPLTVGSRGESVKKVQQLLQTAGFHTLTTSGRYDEATRNCVKDFQKSRNSRETGTVDPLTLIQLYRAANDPVVPGSAGNGKGGGA